MANRRWAIRILLVLTVIAASSIGLFVFARDPYAEQEIERLIDRTYGHRRPGGGRLSGAAYTLGATDITSELGRAQLLLLRLPDSEKRQRFQGLVYLAAGEWDKFVELTNRPSSGTSTQSAALNNLGVSYLALSEKDPAHLLNALDAFQHASALDPKAQEPVFNLVITYRKLHLLKLAEESFARYLTLDPDSEWRTELTNPRQPDEALILERIKRAVENKNRPEAESLFQTYPELCRRIALGYALYNEQESPALVQFIAEQMESRYGDKTISGMLAALSPNGPKDTIEFRDRVKRGAQLYVDGKYEDSLAAYADAASLGDRHDPFDHLWIDLNRADTEIRLGQFNVAGDRLSRIINEADSREFHWLKAKALTIYGSTLRLTSSYGEMINLLSKADRTLIDIDAPRDRIRVLYYLSYYRYFAGDQEEALKLALECLRLVNDQEPIRISTLDWLIGSILYRRGDVERAITFAKESVEQSHKGPYAGGIEFTSSLTLSRLYEAISDHKRADEYLEVAEDLFEQIPEGFDRTTDELQLGIAKAKMKMNQGKYAEAEALLQRNLRIYPKQPFSARPLLSQSRIMLAQVYAKTERTTDAARKFTEAIDIVEKDDEYLQSEVLRVKFDDERRELYDSAIEFEFTRGASDEAWMYLQKYRAKLFLEFLAAFNPDIQPTRSRLDRAGIQQRIPRDTQVVEYASLRDRLLIWLVSDKSFVVRSVPVSRNELEAKVRTVLAALRNEGSVNPLLTELGALLIDPVADLLDSNRSLTIIPDRTLHGIPFGVLKRSGKSNYLIEEIPILISPTLTHFLTGKDDEPARNAIVGFGSQNGSAAEFKELSALAQIYPKATTFWGRQVEKENFLSELKTAGVFHYAGHSATDAVDPLRSAILLDGNRSGPNSVTAVDISRQRLISNAVVILSSCDSSIGNSRDGVGVRGLTSAFLIGGAGSVVGSLWPVEASSTAELMIRFHRSFVDTGKPVAESLREAQLAFLKAFPERSHPYYWSGFVVTGNLSALRN